MKRATMWKVGVTTCLVAGLALADGVKSTSGKQWRVAYHEMEPHKTGDMMIRIQVDDKTGKVLTGKMYRFDSVDNSSGKKKYKRRPDDKGGIVPIQGLIWKSGNADERRKEQFILTGYCVEEDENVYEIEIRGYHSVGSKKGNGNRTDDVCCVRIRKKGVSNFALEAAKASFGFFTDCDDEPPDEDVLTEETENTGMEEDYDGGN